MFTKRQLGLTKHNSNTLTSTLVLLWAALKVLRGLLQAEVLGRPEEASEGPSEPMGAVLRQWHFDALGTTWATVDEDRGHPGKQCFFPGQGFKRWPVGERAG